MCCVILSYNMVVCVCVCVLQYKNQDCLLMCHILTLVKKIIVFNASGTIDEEKSDIFVVL